MYLKKTIYNIKFLTPLKRRTVLVLLDCLIIFLTLYFSYDLSGTRKLNPDNTFFYLFLTFIFIAIPIYIFTGQYKGLTRYQGSRTFYSLAFRNTIIVFVLFLVSNFLKLTTLPYYYFLLIWLSLICFSSVLRIVLRDILNVIYLKDREKLKERVVIYGANSSGAQLLSSIRILGNYSVENFIDDDPSLWYRNINGIPIYPIQSLGKENKKIDMILIAIPSLTGKSKLSIFNKLSKYETPVFHIPSLSSLTNETFSSADIRPINIEDLLCRDTVQPSENLLGAGIKNISVCVTGAGGSIGSELCRQIIKLKPEKLILIDNHEPSLYLIYNEILENISFKDIVIKPILGSILDINLLHNVFSTYNVQKVFHAAAYKHVPLVEENPLQGIYNNVFSTKLIGKASIENNVQDVVLISSDKAVRPTNIMGASKRLSELVFQAFSNEKNISFTSKQDSVKTITRFSMVRFGNVLGSSGSVVPLFKKQIKKGGPITLTDKNMTRYFMTIAEAAQLVIQSSVLSEGGDIFLLDMGEPVRIFDLAKHMIRLSGLKVKDQNSPEGDIEIVVKGKRPGEKIYEELLIEAKSLKTQHPLIYRANEKFISPKELWLKLDVLEKYLKKYDKKKSLEILSQLIPEWENNINR